MAIRCVQVHAMRLDAPNPVEMERRGSLKARLTELGYDPVWEREVDEGRLGNWSYLLVGKLECLPEATLLKHRLRADGCEGAYERMFRNVERTEFQTAIRTPHGKQYVPTAGEALVSNSAEAFTLEPESQRLIEKLKSFAKDELDTAERHLAELPPSAARSRLELHVCQNRMHILRAHTGLPFAALEDKEYVAKVEREILTPLGRIARGEVATSREDAIEASFTIGLIYQEYLANRLRAFDCYTQILEAYGDDMDVRARAMVLRAASLLELARSESAYYNEVRRACAQILHTIPKEYERAHAVADLIYWESHRFEGNWELAAEHLLTFRDRYPNRIREITAAHVCAANALRFQGKLDEAMEALSRNLDYEVDADELFYWAGNPVSMQYSSLKELLFLASDLDLPEEEKAAIRGAKTDMRVPFAPKPFASRRFSIRTQEATEQ
ncbi:MAG: hypothetical protein KF858_03720 [Candidatus Sumerlaeia bacterium]|nr:hypothetical protein [Candidatus Sumerlaeia bacterium]